MIAEINIRPNPRIKSHNLEIKELSDALVRDIINFLLGYKEDKLPFNKSELESYILSQTKDRVWVDSVCEFLKRLLHSIE